MLDLITETSNEFRAKLGQKVDSLNKKNNEDAYKGARKRARDFDGGLRGTKGDDKQIIAANDDNLGMQNLIYDGDTATTEFKDRVKAQMKGYPTKENMDMHEGDDEFGNAIYGGSLSDAEAKHKEYSADKLQGKTMGLTGRETKETLKSARKEGVLEGNDKIKQLYYKNTKFLSEEHIAAKLPDEFKVENKLFIIKDMTGTEYLTEWYLGKPHILQRKNDFILKEELGRIKQLFNYRSGVSESINHTRIVNEDKIMEDMLTKTRLNS